MLRLLRLSVAAFVLAAVLPAAPAAAQGANFVPKPDTYLCPNATGTGAVDCFLNAVEHLYTMCRQIKSIEIIEFGYEKAEEGVNGAKTEYCVDKHKLSMTRPYQSALREATGSRTAVDGLRALHDLWLRALVELKWKPGESDDEYKTRVTAPYGTFRDRADSVRADLSAAKTKVAAPAGAKAKAAVAAARKAAN
ncbi:MAG: hypothetical protein ABI886_15350 [Betaproteobacteria bacterium]